VVQAYKARPEIKESSPLTLLPPNGIMALYKFRIIIIIIIIIINEDRLWLRNDHSAETVVNVWR